MESKSSAADQSVSNLPVGNSLFAKSNHATLEALLKSQPLRTCVPPAPDLHSDVNMGTKPGSPAKGHPHYNSWDPFQEGRDSSSVLIPQYAANKPKTEASLVSPRPRLICDYLGKCSVDSKVRYPARRGSETFAQRINPESVLSESNDLNYPPSERRQGHASKSFCVQGSNVVWSSSALSENGELELQICASLS